MDKTQVVLRAAAILTGSYVGAVVSPPAPLRVQDFDQMLLLVDFTKGSLTDASIKVEFGEVSTDLYQETDESDSVSGGVNTRGVNTVLHKLTADCKVRLAIPLAGDQIVKVSIVGNGTVTSSSAKITAILSRTITSV